MTAYPPLTETDVNALARMGLPRTSLDLPKENTTMTNQKTLAALTATDFETGWTYQHQGINIFLSEDGHAFAYGHVNRYEFAAGVVAMDTHEFGSTLGFEICDQFDVEHLHAITTTAPPEWFIEWGEPDEFATAEGSFPITVVRS